MHNVETRDFKGTCEVNGSAPPAITVPLLPQDGAWVITGEVIAVEPGTPRHSVTYFPQFSGVCTGGVVTLNKPLPLPTQPGDGGHQQGWEPGGLTSIVTGKSIEIQIAGIAGKKIVWAWALKLVMVSLG